MAEHGRNQDTSPASVIGTGNGEISIVPTTQSGHPVSANVQKPLGCLLKRRAATQKAGSESHVGLPRGIK